MLLKHLRTITLAISTLITLLILAGQEAQAVSSISLGFCTSNTTNCLSEWEVFGDPSGDQALPARTKNMLTGKDNDPVVCNSFKGTTEYNLKVCACNQCTGCEDSMCAPAQPGVCTGSVVIGQLHSVCAHDVH